MPASDKKIQRFDGTYNKYIVISNVTYQIKPVTSRIQLVADALKPLFGIDRRKKFLITYRGKKYIGTKPARRENGRIIEEIPFSTLSEDAITAGFKEKLRTIYFFRYLMGFRTTKVSIRVFYDGEKCIPLSYSEAKFSNEANIRTGTGFKITPTREKETNPRYVRVDPEYELKKILKIKYKRITLNHVYDFLASIKKEIIEVDPEFLWLVTSMQQKIMDLIDF